MKSESMTSLLKKKQSDISAVKANKLLVSIEILEDKERPSSKYPDKIKRYKALTPKGLAYGVNRENPNSPEQTTPYYFVEKFDELLLLIQKEIPIEP